MAYYANIALRSFDEPSPGEDSDDTYFPTVHVEAEITTDPEPSRKEKGTVDYCYTICQGTAPSCSSSSSSSSSSHRVYSAYVEPPRPKLSTTHDVHDEDDDDEDDEDDDDEEFNYYVPRGHTAFGAGATPPSAGQPAFAPYSSSITVPAKPDEVSSEMEWTVLDPASMQPQQQQQQEPTESHAYNDPDVYRILANVDAELVKAAVRQYAESLDPTEGEALLTRILNIANDLKKNEAVNPAAGTKPSPQLFSYSSKPAAPAAARRERQFVMLTGQGGKSVSASPLEKTSAVDDGNNKKRSLRGSDECPVGEIGRRDKASVISRRASVVEKNTRWNEDYQQLLATNLHRTELPTIKQLLRLANDFVYTCMTYTKVIVNELNMPVERKTIKPATDVGGLAGGEKYVIQGILFKFCLDPLVSTKGKPVWLYGGDRPSEEKAAKAAALELQGLSLLSALFLPGLHLPLMTLIDFKGFRVLATSLLPLGPDTICYGSHDAGKTVHASDSEFNSMMDQVGQMLNLKKHTVGKKRVPIVGPGDIEGHKGLDGRYYLLDYARLMPSQAPVPSEDGKWDGRGVFYQMLRPEFVRSYTTPLSSDVFTGWSIYDTEREQSEREVIAATQVMINERIPALAAELDAFDTGVLHEIYTRDISKELNPNKIIRFLNVVNLGSRMHHAGINMRHLGRLRQHISNPEMQHYILCDAVSRVLKHKLRNKMRRAVREKRQGDLASEVSCKRVAARVFNKIFGQHPRSAEFWGQSVIKGLRKRFPFILFPEELTQKDYDLRKVICLRMVVAILTTQNLLHLTPDATNAIFSDLTTVKLVSNDIDCIWANVRFNPLINIFDAEVCRRISAQEKNRGLGIRLLESARVKLRHAIEASPSCSYSHWSVARVEKQLVVHPEYDHVAERLFESIYRHLEQSYNMEKSRGPLETWAETLELHAERLDKANGGVATPRSLELRREAAVKRALACETPKHSCDCDGENDGIAVCM